MPRDANGNYVLPAGNPVVSGSLIESTWANTTMPDLGAEMQDSLSRSGKGAMLAPMRLVDFDGPTPGLTFGNEPTTGLRRVAAGDARFSVLGTDVLNMLQTGVTIPVPLQVTGGITGNVSIAGNLAVDTNVLFADASADRVGVGTASPSNILHVSGTDGVPVLLERTSAADCALAFKDSTTVSNPYLGCTGDDLYFATSGGQRLLIDSAGRMGLIVTPKTDWNGNVAAFQFGGIGAFFATRAAASGDVEMLYNCRYLGTGFHQYIVGAEEATRYRMNNGAHIFYVAPAGPADTNITWTTALSIDNNAGISMPNLPTTNPGGSGRLWNDGGTVKIT